MVYEKVRYYFFVNNGSGICGSHSRSERGFMVTDLQDKRTKYMRKMIKGPTTSICYAPTQDHQHHARTKHIDTISLHPMGYRGREGEVGLLPDERYAGR